MEGNATLRRSSRFKEEEPTSLDENDVTESRKVTQDREEETVYEGIRGHERHILSHFFTLFCISFVGGLVLIHLSLWLNVTCGVNISGESVTASDVKEMEMNVTNDSIGEYMTLYTQDSTLAPYFTTKFYYTGNYFSGLSDNELVNNSGKT